MNSAAKPAYVYLSTLNYVSLIFHIHATRSCHVLKKSLLHYVNFKLFKVRVYLILDTNSVQTNSTRKFWLLVV